jgi:hypothetical protein
MAKREEKEEKQYLTVRNRDLSILQSCLGSMDNTEGLDVLDIVKIVKLRKEVKELLEEYSEVQTQILKDFKVDVQDEKSLNSPEAEKAFKKLEPVQNKELYLKNINFMSAEDVITCTKGAKLEVVSILVEYLAKDA